MLKHRQGMYVAHPSMTRNKLLARIGLTFQRLLVEAWSGLQHFTDAYTKPRKAHSQYAHRRKGRGGKQLLGAAGKDRNARV
jgi:hypothetical protein